MYGFAVEGWGIEAGSKRRCTGLPLKLRLMRKKRKQAQPPSRLMGRCVRPSVLVVCTMSTQGYLKETQANAKGLPKAPTGPSRLLAYAVAVGPRSLVPQPAG
jgi:hypothetical protein